MERKRLGSRHIWKLEFTGLAADGKLRIRAASVDEAEASRLYTWTGSRKSIMGGSSSILDTLNLRFHLTFQMKKSSRQLGI